MSKFKKKYKWKDREYHFLILNLRKPRLYGLTEAIIERKRKPIFLGISGYLNKIKDK